ncbi:Ig-like domain repeat protein, partial [Streptomyces sp. GbtcB7]
TPDGTRAYVASAASDSVFVIDTVTNTVIGSPVPVGDVPVGVAIGTLAAERTPTTLTLKVQKKWKWKDSLGAGGKDGVTLKAKLTAEGQPLAGKEIEFTTDSTALCTDTTDSKGKATCKVPGEQPKEICYTATFAGDDTYEPSTSTVCKSKDRKDDPWSEVPDPSDLHDDIHDLMQDTMTSAGLPG